MKRILILAFLLATPLWAVEPDEILDDPALEARARVISKGLRCPVCQNESIDESHAALARDLRLLVRERLKAGDRDQEVIAFIVARYGEFVLLRPTATGGNWLLWVAGPAMLLLAMALAVGFVRARGVVAGPVALSEAEEARLQEILQDEAWRDPSGLYGAKSQKKESGDDL